jgi:hypothetical protein
MRAIRSKQRARGNTYPHRGVLPLANLRNRLRRLRPTLLRLAICCQANISDLIHVTRACLLAGCKRSNFAFWFRLA